MRRMLFVILVFLATFCFVQSVKAVETLNVDCSSGCTRSGTDPLFSLAGDSVWYPGRILTKQIYLKNSGTESKDFKMKGNKTSSTGALEDVFQVSIVKTGGGPVMWSGSLADFYNASEINMGTFAGGAEATYDFSASMDALANNDYQGKETIFDLAFRFWAADTSGGGGGGGDGGTGGGGGAPTCSDTKPGSAPVLLSATSLGDNQVLLNWSSASAPATYYLVSYRTSGGAQYGNPNVGGSGTTSYTVGSLSGGEIYYFKVRAGNGCMPGDFSNELSASVGGGILTGPASGFTEGILGVTSEDSTASSELTPETEGIVEGIQAQTEKNYWWLLLIGLGGFAILIWFIRRRS